MKRSMPTGALAAAGAEDRAEDPGHEMQPGDPAEDRAEGEPHESGAERELFDLLVARTLDMIQQNADDFDQALRADPVKATVEYGTSALHAVTLGADDAGKPVPFNVLIQAGMQVIKELGGIANDKGYLPDEGIETFLKEAFQQSLAKFTKLDLQSGRLSQDDFNAVRQKMGGGQGGAQPGAAPAGPGALAAAGGA